MLTVFEGFRVPGAPVQVYRDDANPNRFHLLTDFPRIATDARTGLPLFSYTLYSRNIAIAYASAKDGAEPETQLGHLTFTCDLSIGDDEWKAVENHLRTVLQNEMSQPSAYNQMFGLWTSSTEPQMGYADTWTTGTVKLEMLESLPDTFVKHSTDDRSPNLRGTMGAAFSVGLGTEGAQLLWQALNPGDRAETAPAGPAAGAYLDAVVTYALTVARYAPEIATRRSRPRAGRSTRSSASARPSSPAGTGRRSPIPRWRS